MALGPLCGPDDVVTPMESNWRSGIPQNYHAENWLGRIYDRSRWFRKCLHRHSRWLGAWYYEHMPAVRVRELVGPRIWSRYYKFCYERNPWEKVVSYYHWKKFGQGRRLPEFGEYVTRKTHRLPRDARLYFEDETCLMDDVFDFRDFRKSFEDVCVRLRIPFDGEMPREKTNMTQHKPNYEEYYTAETQRTVAEAYRREIALMGYNFKELSTDSSQLRCA